jgi:peptide/nickel transport system substrate-binding protein
MKTVTRRQFFGVSASVGLGALLTAIVPAKEVAASGGPAEMADEIVQPASDHLLTPSRSETLIYEAGGLLNIANPLDPGYNHQTGCSSILYEPCAYYVALWEKTIPWLAESYQYNADASQITIHFRRGIRWSDGVEFSAEDAAWTMETLKRVGGLRRGGNYQAELANTEVVDKRTLKIHLNHPDWRFFQKSLTFYFDQGDDSAILPKHIFSQVPDEELASFNFLDPSKGWPVTTGPYGIFSYNDQMTQFDLRPRWWGATSGFKDAPEVKRVQVIPMGSEIQSMQRFVENKIDIGYDLRMLTVAMTMAQSREIKTWSGNEQPFGNIDWWPASLYFNCSQAPFDNPKVRWAVAYAINQQEVVDVAYGGAGSVTGHIFPAFPRLKHSIDGISDLLASYNVLAYDPGMTDSLMQEAGYTKDDQGFWVDANGNKPNANLWGDMSILSDIAMVIAKQLNRAGFDTKLVGSGDNFMGPVASGVTPLFIWGHGGAVFDPLDTFNLYRWENIAPPGEVSWGNLARWGSARFNEICDAMWSIAPDDPAMMDLFREGMQIWLEALPDCPLIQWTHHIPMNTHYWMNWPSQNNLRVPPAMWALTALPMILGLKKK